MAQYSQLAATKLVQLTGSKKAETARKACLDIISVPKIANSRDEQPEKAPKESSQQVEQLSDATASKLLAALAEEKQ